MPHGRLLNGSCDLPASFFRREGFRWVLGEPEFRRDPIEEERGEGWWIFRRGQEAAVST